MYNLAIKRTILILIILISQVLSVNGMEGINTSKNFENISVFVIEFDVKLYSDEESFSVIQKLNYFDPLIVLSDNVSKKGRIKIKLQDGQEGWIEEKFTSYIPKNWVSKLFIKDFFCYIPSNQNMKLTNEDFKEAGFNYEYRNKEYNIIFAVNYKLDYSLIAKQFEDGIQRCILDGENKRLNWSKEFRFKDYKINYVITTDDPEGWIIESFNFIKLNEPQLKKKYAFSTTYKPSLPLVKRLVQRKILFSCLQSLE